MKITVPGHMVLVKPREVKKQTASGILINYAGNEDIERASTVIGTVAAVGPDAWKTMYISGYQGKPWAAVGDEVYYAKYVGFQIKDEATGEYYRVIHDQDIFAVISTEGESNG